MTPLTHHVDGFPVLGLLCPIRLLVRALEFRWALAYLLPTLLHIHYGISRVRSVGLTRDRLGGAFLSAPSTLCGFPVPAWGKQVLPCALLRSELSSPHRVLLSPSDFGLDWLTSQARSVRVPFSRRAMHTSGDSPYYLSAKHGVLRACLPLTAPFRSMLLTLRGGPQCSAPKAHRVPVYPEVK